MTLRPVLLAVALAFAGTAAHAAATCEAQAAERKLSGAAKNSFVKKCEREGGGAGASCEARAADKKLAGAAKNSFMKKCESDAKEAAKPKS
jgi:hypothetical protein